MQRYDECVISGINVSAVLVTTRAEVLCQGCGGDHEIKPVPNFGRSIRKRRLPPHYWHEHGQCNAKDVFDSLEEDLGARVRVYS